MVAIDVLRMQFQEGRRIYAGCGVVKFLLLGESRSLVKRANLVSGQPFQKHVCRVCTPMLGFAEFIVISGLHAVVVFPCQRPPEAICGVSGPSSLLFLFHCSAHIRGMTGHLLYPFLAEMLATFARFNLCCRSIWSTISLTSASFSTRRGFRSQP